MSSHSSILGGSNAARLLNCPASYQEQMKSPLLDMPSAYAAEGTALHEAIAVCLSTRSVPLDLVGHVFNGIEMSHDHAVVLESALAALDALTTEYGGKFRIVGIEQTLPLPGVTGAFGSVDLVLSNKDTVIVIDWKFGAGVPVRVLYDEGDYEIVNPQLAFYATTARHRHRRMFRNRRIVLAIIQPRLEPPLSHCVTDDEELDDFQKAFEAAVLAAMGREPFREKGEHCRFALCKATCPLWTGPLFDLADLDPAKAAIRASVERDPTDYERFLAKALDAATLFETWAVEIRRQAHVYMDDGGKVEGWKLVPKRATRQWVNDEQTTFHDLLAIGADEHMVYEEPKLRSVAQMEKVLKPRGITIPKDLYNQVSSGTTIAPADDSRPESTSAVEDLRQALKALA